ncbi:inovirus-type Gp2 protein [Janthinobacterium sp.]|uniref:rolling circle replication-associated protein n=1 Tax=Janthinobacterium sp. TaxID=1871054 RepID=UPI0028A0F3E4|nr:inovirus-type Gp2 protein [Janthinobacterium sp.]
MIVHEKINQLEEKSLNLEKRMFEVKSRYLVLFLTLNYKPDYRDDMTIDDIQQHRDKLFNNRRSNTFLKGIKGYIWKIEEGKEAGLHVHLLIFYAGDHRADVYIARKIGDYWEDKVTKGTGSYWNSNADKNRILARGLRVGVGQIDRNHLERRKGLHAIIHYMAKDEPLAEHRHHCRTFGMSQSP